MTCLWLNPLCPPPLFPVLPNALDPVGAQVSELHGASVVEAAINNLLQLESSAVSIAASALSGQLDRFNAWRFSEPLPGEAAADHRVWLNTWHHIDLSSLPSFPMWEKEVHDLLHADFGRLRAIFSYYSKLSSCGEMATAKTVDAHEFLSFCHDLSLFSTHFDELSASGLFRKIAPLEGVGERGRAGGLGERRQPRLTLPTFLRLLTEMAYLIANPSPSAAGSFTPVPLCLATFLSQVLPNAKRDDAPSFRRIFRADERAAATLSGREEKLRELWRVLSGGRPGGVALGAVLSLLSKRLLLKSCEVLGPSSHWDEASLLLVSLGDGIYL